MTVVDRFVEWAHTGLLQSEEAQEYLLSRGVSAEQWVRHKIGYVIGDFCPDPRMDSEHSSSCGSRDIMHKWCDTCRFVRWSSVWGDEADPRTQIVGRKIFGSVVMPLTSYSGAIVGFQTRSIKGKEFNSFSLTRRPEGYFFGIAANIEAIWTSRRAIVVEGPFDCLVIERLVAPDVVALTTNTSNSGQTRFFRRFVEEVVTLLDTDRAGRDGVETIRMKMIGGPSVRDIKYDVRNLKGDKCKDVNEAWQVLGDKRFAKLFSNLIERL
jgi:DNA primase